MSTYYYVYLEAQIDNEWKLVCPSIKTKDNKDTIMPIINGSRSWFGAMGDKILELGNCIEFSELSLELKKEINKDFEDEEPIEYEENPSWFRAYQCNVNSYFKSLPPDDCKEYHGYVNKNNIMSYKLNHEEIYDWLDLEEYRELPQDEKQIYEYFEWNNTEGWVDKFLQMKPIISWLIDNFCEANSIYNTDNINFRLICYEC